MKTRAKRYVLLKIARRDCGLIFKTFYCLVITFLILSFGFNHLAFAKRNKDLLKLDLKELMGIEILSKNVLETHTHLKNKWMISYQYRRMHMEGNRSGTTDQTESEVLNSFMVAPLRMTTDMHKVVLMHGLTDNITTMWMLPYIYKKMDHINRAGVKFDTRSHGLGDFKVTAIYTLYGKVKLDEYVGVEWGQHRILLHGGVSFPTGSINKKDSTPTKERGTLPFPMQLGSGTFDLLPTISYIGETYNGNWAWSLETRETIRVGRNSHKYRLGNRYSVSGRLVRKVTDKLSLSVKTTHNIWGDVHGRDFLVNPTSAPTVPTKRPDLQGGERTDISIGADFYLKGKKEGVSNRFGINFGFPVYQSLDGPQLEKDWEVNFAWGFVWF